MSPKTNGKRLLASLRTKDGGYFSRLHGWLAGILAPLLIAGVMTAGFAAPANALEDCTPNSDTACLTITKVIQGGGPASVEDWTFTAQGRNSSNNSNSGSPYTFVSGDNRAVPRNNTSGNSLRSYRITESDGPAYYDLTSIVCTGASNNGSFSTQNGRLDGLVIANRQQVNCTITNKYNPPQMATITVHAGDQRASGGTVTALPAGATFVATPVSGNPAGGPFQCAIAEPTLGQCSITVPRGYQWDIAMTQAPDGFYRNATLDFGTNTSVSPSNYVFRTDGTVSSNIDVPSGSWSASVPDQRTRSGSSRPSYSNYFSGLLAASRDNPDVQPICGLRIAIVMDQSASMDTGGRQASLKAAAKSVVNSLTGTPSTLALYQFGTNAGTSLSERATSSANKSDFDDYIDGLSAGGSGVGAYTNWDAGLRQVINKGFNLVIFLTDGAPTTWGDNSGSTNSYFEYVEQGIFSANAVKAHGTRIVGIGIGFGSGNDAEANLRAVTGPDKNDDYYLASNADFGTVLKNLAAGVCSKVITVQKKILKSNGTEETNSTDANGWGFSGQISAGSIGSFADTAQAAGGQNGFTQADVTITAGTQATITVTEDTESKNGFTFEGAQCKVDNQNVTTTVDKTAGTATFTADAGKAITCVFTNKRVPLYTVTVEKDWQNSVSGDVASITLNGDTKTSTAPTDGTVVTGSFEAGTAITITESLSGTKGSYSGSLACVDSSGKTVSGSSDGTFTMPSQNVVCTYTNSNARHAVTLQKEWKNAFTGDKVDLYVNDGSKKTSTASGTDGVDTTNVSTANAYVGSTVTLKELAAAGNTGVYGSTLQCVGANNAPVAVDTSDNTHGSITMPDSDVTCTFTNTAQTRTVTIVKNWVDAVAGDTAAITVNGTTVLSPVASTSSQVVVHEPIGGAVVIAETLAAGNTASYTKALQCDVTTTGWSFTMPQDRDVTCTITNTATKATLTLVKHVENGTSGATFGSADWTLSATPSGITGQSTLSGDGGVAKTEVKPGTYTLREVANAGQLPGWYAASAWTCSIGDDPVDVTNDAVTVPASADVECEITNTAVAPKLTLTKTVVDTNGGDATAAAWTLTAKDAQDATALSGTSGVTGTVAIGTYSLSEAGTTTQAQKGYERTGLACYPAGHPESPLTLTGDSVTLGLGADVECRFTNASIAPTLQLKKVVAGAPGVSNTNWVLAGTGADTPAVTNPAGGDTSVVTVKAGKDYVLGELAKTLSFDGWAEFQAGDWVCADASGQPLTLVNVGSGTGLASLSGLTVGQKVVCTITNTHRSQGVAIDKTVTGTAQNADGTWTTTYDVTVTNKSKVVATTYDLTDTLEYGAGITVDSASWTGPSTGTWVLPGVTAQLADDAPLAANGTDSYTVTVVSTVTTAAWESGATRCLAGGIPGGFLNSATVTAQGASQTARDCAAPSKPSFAKQFVSAIPDLDDPGTWTVNYTLTVDNSANGNANYYTLLDTPSFAPGVTIGGVTVDGSAAAFDGTTVTVVGSPTMIGAGGTKAYALAFTVTVGEVKTADLQCSQSGAGHGFFNAATLTVGGYAIPSTDCGGITEGVKPAVTKTALVPTQNADGSWTVVYDITVAQPAKGDTNPQGLSAKYDLSDTLAFGAGIGVTGASWTKNGGASHDWSVGFGQEQTLASGAVIKAGATDTYRVTVLAEVSQDAVDEGTALCQPDAEQHSGFLNTALLTVGSSTTPAEDCSEPALPTVDKRLDSQVDNGDGTWDLGFLVTVSNPSATTDARFTLTDVPAGLPDGTTAEGDWTAVAADAGTPAPKTSSWADGDTATLAEGTLAAGTSYAYLVSVTVRVSATENGAPETEWCGEQRGIVISNAAAVASGEVSSSAEDCGVVQYYDIGIAKSHAPIDGGAVDSGKDQPIAYTLTVTNHGTDWVDGIVVDDPMPAGLTIDTTSLQNPSEWDFTGTTTTQLKAVYLGDGGWLAPGDSAAIAFTAIVGDLARSDADSAYPDIANTACVAMGQNVRPTQRIAPDQSEGGRYFDGDSSNDCATDTTPVKSVAVLVNTMCVLNAPYLGYTLTPHNVSQAPTIAIIWWTQDAYDHRDPSIDASDETGILADGASAVDYVTLPAGWQDGDPITGRQLWPGAAVDANGNGVAWPGWRQLPTGQWVLDPGSQYYPLRSGAVVEVRINPTTALAASYPSEDCAPKPGLAGLVDTGSDLTGSMIWGGGMLGLGIVALIGAAWIGRRRREEGRES